MGTPHRDSPVLVTANYKLSFDLLRFELAEVDCWILVVDTRGINVWCAAGKGTFSTDEVVLMVKQTRIAELVSHNTLIVPQLCAGGVSSSLVKKKSGFRIIFGPVQARDLPEFLERDNTASEGMRAVTFTLMERVELIPVELYLQLKTIGFVLIAGFLFAWIGPHMFSLQAIIQRTLHLGMATLLGLLCGSVFVPILLPWLPCRQFWLKGLWPPLLVALCWGINIYPHVTIELLSLSVWMSVFSSFQAMNFTGCTPYTSPSGVEYEMRRGIPVLALLAILALLVWLVAPFVD